MGGREVHVVTVRCYESAILEPDGTIWQNKIGEKFYCCHTDVPY